MGKKIRQIDINETLELARKGGNVYVITNPNKPGIKSLNNMSVGDVFAENTEFIFFVIEEA